MSTELEKQNQLAIRRQQIDELEAISYEEYERQVKEWMLVADPGIIKLIPILIVANYIPGAKPVWCHIVGPSGGGKTEFLQAFSELDYTYILSLLTSNTLLSGMPGRGDMSLLPKIDGKVVLFFDWTNITSQPRDAQQEIMGQLRDAYDGHVKKDYGNGKSAEWGPGGKFGLISGVTQMVDQSQQATTALGERFIQYRITMPDRMAVADMASKNAINKKAMEIGMANAGLSFMKGITLPRATDEMPKIPEDFRKEIVEIANFITRARSAVIREYGMKKEVLFVPTPEMPTRLPQQLIPIATADMLINPDRQLSEVGKNIVKKIAFDSVPLTNMMAIKQLATKSGSVTTKDVALGMGYPTSPVRMYLENLSLLGVIDRIKGDSGGNADHWKLKPVFQDLITRNFSDELMALDAKFIEAKESEPEPEEDDAWDDIPDEYK